MAKSKTPSHIATTSEHLKEFVKLFESLRYRHNAFNTFSDFVTCAAISISNAVNYDDDREKEYLRIINKYNEGEREKISQMFACIVAEMQKDSEGTPRYRDVLGELFHSLNLQDEWKGQFFTPQNVSDMVGVIQAESAKSIIEKRGYVRLLEPCIGGGSMVLGVINGMFQVGLQAISNNDV